MHADNNTFPSASHTATSSAHLEDLAYLDEQRHTPLRTSLRMPRQSTTCGPGRSGQDLRGEQTHTPEEEVSFLTPTVLMSCCVHVAIHREGSAATSLHGKRPALLRLELPSCRLYTVCVRPLISDWGCP